jgi:hypothetical protein
MMDEKTEALLELHQQHIEQLENELAEVVSHVRAQSHLMHLLARQLQIVAHEAEVDIPLVFRQ